MLCCMPNAGQHSSLRPTVCSLVRTHAMHVVRAVLGADVMQMESSEAPDAAAEAEGEEEGEGDCEEGASGSDAETASAAEPFWSRVRRGTLLV